MTPDAEHILASLQQVAARRLANARDADVLARVSAIKDFQQRRFRLTYASLLSDPRYGAAARFFLEELYGPGDFSERDAQFERVVPALARLFPKDTVHTVRLLAELHALSERLDATMADHVSTLPVTAPDYVLAWQATAEPALRERQIQLMLQVGDALDRYTRNPLLRNSLRVMRGPARAAGLASLQRFLETGFDTFRAMKGAGEFLSTIARQERALAADLFDAPLDNGLPPALAQRLPS